MTKAEVRQRKKAASEGASPSAKAGGKSKAPQAQADDCSPAEAAAAAAAAAADQNCDDEQEEDVPEWYQYLPPVLGSLIYFPSLNGELFFDDLYAINRNRDVTRPDEVPLSQLFKNDYWGSPMSDPASHKSYRPLVVMTFRWNHMVHGLDPYGYHLVNVFFHALCSWLLYFAAQHIFRDFREKHKAALLAATFFAVHPIHCEAVSEVVGRAEVMSTFFFLLAFIAGVKATHATKTCSNPLWVILTIATTVCSVLSKEIGITVIGCICAFDTFLVLRPLESKDRMKRIPPYVLRQLLWAVGAGFFLSWRLKMNAGHHPTWPKLDNPAAAGTDILPKVMNYPYIWTYNLWLLFVPWQLCGDYTYLSIPPIETPLDWRNLVWIGATLGMLVTIAWGVGLLARNRTPRPTILIALAFGVIPFLPSTNLFFPVGFLVAERVLYIPSIGFCLWLAAVLALVPQEFGALGPEEPGATPSGEDAALAANTAAPKPRPHRSHGRYGRMATAVASCLIIVYSGRSVLRNRDFRTAELFWLSVTKVVPGNSKAYFNLGNMMFGQDRLEDAITNFKKAVEILPDDPTAYVNMATAYFKLERHDDAIAMYSEAARYVRHFGQFFNWGLIHEMRGEYDKAMEIFDIASTYNPHSGRMALYQDDLFAKAHCAVHLGTLLCREHRSEEGIKAFKRALSIIPTIDEAWMRLGLESAVNGDMGEALYALDKVIEIDPNQRNTVAQYLANQGNIKEARRYNPHVMPQHNGMPSRAPPPQAQQVTPPSRSRSKRRKKKKQERKKRPRPPRQQKRRRRRPSGSGVDKEPPSRPLREPAESNVGGDRPTKKRYKRRYKRSRGNK